MYFALFAFAGLATIFFKIWNTLKYYVPLFPCTLDPDPVLLCPMNFYLSSHFLETSWKENLNLEKRLMTLDPILSLFELLCFSLYQSQFFSRETRRRNRPSPSQAKITTTLRNSFRRALIPDPVSTLFPLSKELSFESNHLNDKTTKGHLILLLLPICIFVFVSKDPPSIETH